MHKAHGDDLHFAIIADGQSGMSDLVSFEDTLLQGEGRKVNNGSLAVFLSGIAVVHRGIACVIFDLGVVGIFHKVGRERVGCVDKAI